MAVKDYKIIHSPEFGAIVTGTIYRGPDEPERIPLSTKKAPDVICPGCETVNGCICACFDQEG